MIAFSLNWFLGILTVELWIVAYSLVFWSEIRGWISMNLFGRRPRRGDQMSGEANARGRIPLARFADDVGSRQLRQLLADRLHKLPVGDDQRPLWRHEPRQSVERQLNHRPAAAEVEQLLGRGGAAEGPEASAEPSGHDHGMQHERVSMFRGRES